MHSRLPLSSLKPAGPKPAIAPRHEHSPAASPSGGGGGASEVEVLRSELAAATAARDALAHQFASLLSQNAALLRATRSLDGAARASSPSTYAGALLQRRRVIAAAELLEELGAGAGAGGSPAGGSGGGSGGGGGGGGGGDGGEKVEEVKQLREAVALQLERLRSLRWRELYLESNLAGAWVFLAPMHAHSLHSTPFPAATPAPTLPRTHPAVFCRRGGGFQAWPQVA